MTDDISRDQFSFAGLGVPSVLDGVSTTGFSSLNFPQNTQTASASVADNLDAQYPFVKTNVTPSGHTIQYNDTPGSERVLIKHRTGAAVDMLPNGNIEISSPGAGIITIRKDFTIIVSGNVKYQVDGNFDLDVKGNFNVKALNVNTNIEGNKTETILGSSRTSIAGNEGVTVKGNSSHTVKGTTTNTTLGNSNNITKGKAMHASSGDFQIASGGNAKLSSPASIDVSSASINIAAQSTTVVGSSGTFGGQGVVVYGLGANFSEGVTAPTFHGDLDGTAAFAVQADVTNSQNYADPDPGGGVGAAQGYIVNSVATPTTALPNGALMTEYLTVSSKGIPDVKVDQDGEISRLIDRTSFTGGLSTTDLTTNGVRDKLRDEANLQNSTFINGQIAAGNLNPTALSSAPPSINNALPADASVWRATPDMGSLDPGWIKPAVKPARKSFLPDFKNYITDITEIKENTSLLDDIPLSTFLRDK